MYRFSLLFFYLFVMIDSQDTTNNNVVDQNQYGVQQSSYGVNAIWPQSQYPMRPWSPYNVPTSPISQYPNAGYPGYLPYPLNMFGNAQYQSMYSPFYQNGAEFGMGGGTPFTGVGAGPTNPAITEIIDVPPEYHQQLLGIPLGAALTSYNQLTQQRNRPKYTVDVQTSSNNVTQIPYNVTKPIFNEKKYVTSIKRTFVYDSNNPKPIEPINLHIVNGEPVTIPPPPETTENADVVGVTSWYDA